MSKFIVTYKPASFFYVLQTDSGENILACRIGYVSKRSCKTSVNSVRINSQKDHHYELKKTPDNKFFFELRAINGSIVGISEMFETEERRQACMDQVKAIAPDAELVDLVE